MAADLGTMKARIARELHRNDLGNVSGPAIQSAIRQHRSRNFEFNDSEADFITSQGVDSYAPVGDVAQMYSLTLEADNYSDTLVEMNWPEFSRLHSPSAQGVPCCYSSYGGRIYLGPTPNGSYAIRFRYRQRMAAPVADADVTVWTDQAEELIRQSAKKRLCRDVLRDGEGFLAAEAAEREALGVLLAESYQLQDEGGLAPSWGYGRQRSAGGSGSGGSDFDVVAYYQSKLDPLP